MERLCFENNISTVVFILINLIISSIIEVLFIILQGAATIIGIVCIIFTIIALIRWSTYKDWFQSLGR